QRARPKARVWVYGMLRAPSSRVNASHRMSEVSSIEVIFHDLSDIVRRVTRAQAKKITRWPVVLCGLCALFAASAAFTMSPVASREPVRPVLDAARVQAGVAQQYAEYGVAFTTVTFDHVAREAGLTR